MSISNLEEQALRNELRRSDERVRRLEGQMSTFIKNNSVATYHSSLLGLDYASAGHTGFTSSSDFTSHTGDATIHFLEGAIDHTAILNIGSNSHATIDTHLASTANPHTVTLDQALTGGATTLQQPSFKQTLWTDAFSSTVATMDALGQLSKGASDYMYESGDWSPSGTITPSGNWTPSAGTWNLAGLSSLSLPTDSVAVSNIADGTDGELITWDATGEAVALGVGTSGQFLQTAGAGAVPAWADVAYTSIADGTDGELITWDAAGAVAAVAVGTATHVLTSNGAGAAPTFQAPSGASPLTTKGDVFTYAAADARLAVGSNNDFFVADSAASTGNKWFDLFGTENTWDTVGQNFAAGIFTHSADYTTYSDTGSQVNANYVLVAHTGVLTKQYVGMNISNIIYPDLTSTPTGVGVLCKTTWGDSGNYAGSVSYIRGGQFAAVMTHENGTATEVTGGQFLTQGESGSSGNIVKVQDAAGGVFENQIGYAYYQWLGGFNGIQVSSE